MPNATQSGIAGAITQRASWSTLITADHPPDEVPAADQGEGGEDERGEVGCGGEAEVRHGC